MIFFMTRQLDETGDFCVGLLHHEVKRRTGGVEDGGFFFFYSFYSFSFFSFFFRIESDSEIESVIS